MQRLWSFLVDARTLAVIGLAALAAFLFLGANELRIAAVWAAVLLGSGLVVAGIVWLLRRRRERRAAAGLEAALEDQAAQAVRAAEQSADADRRAEVEALRDRMREAIRTLKRSRLGHASRSQALYALPWYLVIGNPAAGKSTAVVRSGLQFPFADAGASGSAQGHGPAGSDAILQGIGGTRNCDWFFTTEGILLDTAGRYAVHDEDRGEWLGFLGLLKKHRPRAPINGIVVAASLSELVGARPEFGIELAKQLRQRMQEITEQLEVEAPVYVVFTKADLIAGFAEFFMDRDPAERERAWGATLPYAPAAAAGAPQPASAALQFDRHFELLYAGLKDSSVAHMAQHRGEQLPPGVLAFPLEFAALKPALRNFIATLFEDNPYQFRPVFRGFYFTSAVQQGESTGRASARVAQRFALGSPADAGAAVYSNAGFFLKGLFSKVIFADRQLVRQRMSPAHRRMRLAGFLGGAATLGLVLGLLTWSYVGNQRLLADTRADLDAAAKLQENRLDLGSRLDALQRLQDRLAQLQGWRESHPWSVGLGLYQGDRLEAGLRREYFNGLRVVALKPVAESLEAYLQEVNAQSDQLKPLAQAAAEAPAAAASGTPSGTPYAGAQPTDVSDAYNALKTYLMLTDRRRLEAGHAGDQLTRFWRGWLEANRGGMPREELIRKAEGIVSYALTQMAAADFPQIEPNLGLVDATRENLRRVVRGMPARERVYAEIKARAATRFAPLTVASITGDSGNGVVAGSTAVSGVYTKAAWNSYVRQAIEDAANKELQAEDWVLKSALRDDLTLEGSPQAIQKALTEQYKQEYVREWKRFMQGVSVAEFTDFDGAITKMNRLGDPAASPLGKLMQALYDETSWDNPSLVNERLAQARGGVVEWFKRSVLGQVPSQVNVNVQLAGTPGEVPGYPVGPVGREFAGVGKLMMTRDGGSNGAPTQMRQYLDALSRLRTRFNQIKTQGDPGPAARALMQATLDGGGSELADALRIVDEQMLTGMGDTQKAALRPLLVRPLMQAYAVLVPAAESELNRVWQAQVAQPFAATLAPKYPFDPASRIEAAPAEIGKFFGPEGAIAKYTEQALSGLTVRRGDVLTPRTWADMGIRLQPAFATAFAGWVAPVAGSGAAGSGGSGATAGAQTVFQILPLPAPGLTEYTLEIDGQHLRYRNTQAAWTSFVWPNAQGAPGVKISGVAFDGRNVEFLNVPGNYGLEKMLGAAQRRKLDAATFELKWASGSLAVPVKLRIVSSAGAAAAAASGATSGAAGSTQAAATWRGLQLPARVAGADAPAPDTAAAAADALAQAAPGAGSAHR